MPPKRRLPPQPQARPLPAQTLTSNRGKSRTQVGVYTSSSVSHTYTDSRVPNTGTAGGTSLGRGCLCGEATPAPLQKSPCVPTNKMSNPHTPVTGASLGPPQAGGAVGGGVVVTPWVPEVATDSCSGPASFPTASQSRHPLERPVLALSVNIMAVYKDINVKFCRERRRTVPGATHNNGFDDRDGHYIPITGEEIAMRYTVQEELGKGSFGTVLRCWDEKYQEPVAVKVIRSGDYFAAQGSLEAEIVAYLNRNPALENLVVQLRKALLWQGHIVLVFELLSFNLYQLIRCTKFNGVSLDLTRKFAYQLLQVLLQLERHDPPIIHSDLKPENVLLRDRSRSGIRVIDFGSSCYQQCATWLPPPPSWGSAAACAASHDGPTLAGGRSSTSHAADDGFSRQPPPPPALQFGIMPKYIQSRYYRSPEVVLELGYTTAIDRWSLACMLVELHTGVPLFPGRNEADMLRRFTAMLGPLPDFMIAGSTKAARFYFDLPKEAGRLGGVGNTAVYAVTTTGPSSADNAPSLPSTVAYGLTGMPITASKGLAATSSTEAVAASDLAVLNISEGNTCIETKIAVVDNHGGDAVTGASISSVGTVNTTGSSSSQPVPTQLRAATAVSAAHSSITEWCSGKKKKLVAPQRQLSSPPVSSIGAGSCHSPLQSVSSLLQRSRLTSPNRAGLSGHTAGSPYYLREPLDPSLPHSLEEVLGVGSGGPRGCRRGQPGHDDGAYRTFFDFINGLLRYDPRERMSCAEAMNHPFLQPLLDMESLMTSAQEPHIPPGRGRGAPLSK